MASFKAKATPRGKVSRLSVDGRRRKWFRETAAVHNGLTLLLVVERAAINVL